MIRNFIYLKSNRSGIGDRIMDIILVYTYSQYLKYDNFFLSWEENGSAMTGKGISPILRQQKTPFRNKDYLLNNLLNYIILPKNINFVSNNSLLDNTKDSESYVFNKYLGMRHTLYSFMNEYVESSDKNYFEQLYFDNFSKIQFKNIPSEIVNHFNNNDVITIHLRRGDKVSDDAKNSNGIYSTDLDNLNNKTKEIINKLINQNYKYFNFVSDEKSVRDNYYELFKDKVNCFYFNGDDITQTYYDLYMLSFSKKIILSQAFSVFSIMSAMIGNNELHYIFDHKKMNQFKKYKNISKF